MQRDTLEVRTADNVGIGYETAGIGSRFTAFCLDALILGVIVVAADILVSALGSAVPPPQLALLELVFVPFFGLLAYFVVAETASAGRTPGKRALGLRVIRVEGTAPGFVEALLRNLARIVDLTAGLGLICMFFHPQSRRLGDLLAGTLVVRESPRPVAPPLPTVLLRTPDAGPAIDGIERLGTAEQSAVRALLARPGLTPEQRQRLATEMARRLLDRLDLPASAPERQWPAELFLERLYLQLGGRLAGR